MLLVKSGTAVCGYAARRLVWCGLCRHRPSGEPPIIILTSRRSGGTWITDTLSAERGLLCVLQPFAVGASDPFLRWNGRLPGSLYENSCVPVRPSDETWMTSFLADVLDGSLAVGWPANPFSRRFQARTNRVLVKFHNVKAWTDWIADAFPSARILLHFRHPIPQAFSAMRSGWPLRTQAYLNDRNFTERWLQPAQKALALRRAETGSAFEKALLNWLVENHVPLQLLRDGGFQSNWTVTTYEETVVNPGDVFARLVERLELSCGEAVMKRMRLASHTVFDAWKKSLIENRTGALSREKALLCAWQERINPAERAAAERLFEAFALECYRVDSPFPAAELLLRSSTPSHFEALQA